MHTFLESICVLFPDHFLDTCIIIGFCSKELDDEQSDIAVKYMALPDIRRCTSSYPYERCDAHFNRYRSTVIRFLDKLRNKPLPNNIKELNKFLDDAINSYKATERTKKKDIEILESFVNQYTSVIAEEKQSGKTTEEIVTECQSRIKEKTQDINDDLEILVNTNKTALVRLYEIPDRYSYKYVNQIDGLKELNIKSDDCKTLLEAFCVSREHIKRELNFITLDDIDILSLSGDIKAILSEEINDVLYRVHPLHPSKIHKS
jgi:hypothetical protein